METASPGALPTGAACVDGSRAAAYSDFHYADADQRSLSRCAPRSRRARRQEAHRRRVDRDPHARGGAPRRARAGRGPPGDPVLAARAGPGGVDCVRGVAGGGGVGRHGAGPRRSARRRAWTTVVSAAFSRDAASQVAWLVAQDREDWALGLKVALRTARAMLERNPALTTADDGGVRRLLLGRLPLFLWYRLDDARREVVWLRLFHVRQSGARRRR